MPVPRRAAERAPARERVVVAVDAGRASVAALTWALRHAGRHGLTVEVVTVWPLHGSAIIREVRGRFCEPQWQAREVQAAAVAEALAAVEDAPAYELRVVRAELVDALARARHRAVMVVIGTDSPPGGTVDRSGLSEQVRRGVRGPVVVIGPDGAERTSAPLRRQAE